MRALTVRQPQAVALLSPSGPLRHPGWRTDHRGPLLIHAARRGAGDPHPSGPGKGPAYGALLGVVELVDCVACRHAGGDPDEAGFVWVLSNPRAFRRPVPHAGGRPGLFDVADAVVADALAAPAPRPRKRRKGRARSKARAG
jgi:hypothetical protein